MNLKFEYEFLLQYVDAKRSTWTNIQINPMTHNLVALSDHQLKLTSE